MSNKGRLPASGLGAKRPEQLILVHVCSGTLLFAPSLIPSFPLSLSLSTSLSSLSHSLTTTCKGFPHPASLVDSIRSLPLVLSPLLCLSGTRTPLARSILHRSCSTRHLHPSQYDISPSSASSSPSVSIAYAFHRCRHPIVAAAFGCRLCPGHQYQRHHF